MSTRTDVPPSTVGIQLLDYGVEIEYLDGRKTVYRGIPKTEADTLRTSPGKQTHVLVTDPTETEGVMLYVNDFNTSDEILEDSGVGRIVLEPGEEEEVFPGVTVRRVAGERCEVEADPEVARGRVFVFVEDDWGEDSYELVNAGDEDVVDAADADAESIDDARGESDGDALEKSANEIADRYADSR